MTDVEMLDLADEYLKGVNRDKDEEKAAQLYHQVALNGDYIGCRKYARCFRDGAGVEKNDGKAIEWYKKAIGLGDDAALYELAWVYYNTKDKEYQSRDEAERYCFEAIKQDRSAKLAYSLLGRMEMEGQGGRSDKDKGFEYFSKSYELGNRSVANNLGQCYFFGQGTAVDYGQAVSLFRIAVERNNKAAMVNLGICYDKGYGVEKDEHKALELYRAAQKLNYAYATEKIVNQWIRAEDPSLRNEQAAYDYMIKCLEDKKGYCGDYAYELGLMYKNGCTLFDPDTEKAKMFFSKGRDRNHPGCKRQLVLLMLDDCQSRETAEEAYALVNQIKAPKLTERALLNLLGYMEPDEIKALAFKLLSEKKHCQAYSAFERIADTDASAGYAAGMLCELGLGVEQNSRKACEFFEKSQALGSPYAEKALKLSRQNTLEHSAIICPYCGNAMVTRGEEQFCEICGEHLPVGFMSSVQAIIDFNRANRLRQNGFFFEAGEILDTMIKRYRDKEALLWCKALSRYGVRFSEGSLNFSVGCFHNRPFEEYCDKLSFGFVNKNAWYHLTKKLNDETKRLADEFDKLKDTVYPHVVIAADPRDELSVGYALQLENDFSSNNIPAARLNIAGFDKEGNQEVKRALMVNRACVFIRAVSDKSYLPSGFLKTQQNLFAENPVGSEYKKVIHLTVGDNSVCPGEEIFSTRTPKSELRLQINKYLSDWYRSYQNLLVSPSDDSRTILDMVNRHRAAIGQPPFGHITNDDFQELLVRVREKDKKKAIAVINNSRDDTFDTVIYARKPFKRSRVVKTHWTIYDMFGNEVQVFDSEVPIERKEKNINQIFQTWYVRYPSTGGIVFNPGFYYCFAQTEGMSPVGSCFAVVDSDDSPLLKTHKI